MPDYEVVERHHIHVKAPAAITLAAAKDLDILDSAVVRGLFKARAMVLGGKTTSTKLPHTLAEQVAVIGWCVLAEMPGTEIVFGAVVKPWESEPVFRGLSASDFAAFNEPDYVKIVWTLRADAYGLDESIFRSETRVSTTDAGARAKFRRYWAFASPGVALIRRLMLMPVKAEAERRAKLAQREEPAGELRAVV